MRYINPIVLIFVYSEEEDKVNESNLTRCNKTGEVMEIITIGLEIYF